MLVLLVILVFGFMCYHGWNQYSQCSETGWYDKGNGTQEECLGAGAMNGDIYRIKTREGRLCYSRVGYPQSLWCE